MTSSVCDGALPSPVGMVQAPHGQERSMPCVTPMSILAPYGNNGGRCEGVNVRTCPGVNVRT